MNLPLLTCRGADRPRALGAGRQPPSLLWAGDQEAAEADGDGHAAWAGGHSGEEEDHVARLEVADGRGDTATGLVETVGGMDQSDG